MTGGFRLISGKMDCPLLSAGLCYAILLVGCCFGCAARAQAAPPAYPAPSTRPNTSSVSTSSPIGDKKVVNADGFSLLGRPTKAQPVSGRAITCLRRFGDSIYIGYGDWNNNTGPIQVIAYDSATGRFKTGPRLATEAIDRMRVINGKLVVPETDHHGWFWTHSDVHFFDGKRWTFVRIPRAVHVFDVAEFKGAVYVSYQYDERFDTKGPHRVAMIKNGKLVDPKSMGQIKAGRIWSLAVCNDRLFAFPTVGAQAQVFDGKRWQWMIKDAADRGVITACESNGKDVVLIGDAGKYYANAIGGHSAWHLDAQGRMSRIKNFEKLRACDVKHDQGSFYLMTHAKLPAGQATKEHQWRASIYKSSNLKQWQMIATSRFSSLPLSLEVHKASVYIGLENGQLWAGPMGQ